MSTAVIQYNIVASYSFLLVTVDVVVPPLLLPVLPDTPPETPPYPAETPPETEEELPEVVTGCRSCFNYTMCSCRPLFAIRLSTSRITSLCQHK